MLYIERVFNILLEFKLMKKTICGKKRNDCENLDGSPDDRCSIIKRIKVFLEDRTG